MRMHEFSGVQVHEESYAHLAEIIEKVRALILQAQKNGAPIFWHRDFEAVTFPSGAERGQEVVTVSVDELNQVLNALMVQAGSMCHLGRPESVIEHRVDAFDSYYQCGHTNPIHYWDDQGNQLANRP